MLDRQLKTATTRGTRRSVSAPSDTPEARSLKRERDRVHGTVSVLSKRLAALFDCFVVERCRDTVTAIRCDVVRAVGGWTVHCSGQFLHDRYLRYLAWGMADRVRRASASALHTPHPHARRAAHARMPRMHAGRERARRGGGGDRGGAGGRGQCGRAGRVCGALPAPHGGGHGRRGPRGVRRGPAPAAPAAAAPPRAPAAARARRAVRPPRLPSHMHAMHA